MKKRFFLISVFALLALENIAAQSNRLFTADNDLSSSFIHKVYADSQNIIWVATEDGLNKYDGAKFTIFKNRENDSLSLPHNYVRTIFESKDRQLFFGLFNGLALYERGSRTFQRIPLILENQNEYPSHVTAMAELKNGKIIIGTAGQGLFDYNPEDKTGHVSYLNKAMESNFIEHLYHDNLG
ncbi:MAG: two-component regulator propeller domain-containing protein, partial [Christiangramia sp.]|nr:two-component regulator propeller domain-containing protein [Christiangramia sp.]